MAAIDYAAIEEALRSQIETVAGSAVTTVVSEEELIADLDNTPWVGVYLLRREPESGQVLAAGKRVRYILRFAVWTYGSSWDALAKATEARDDAMGAVELAIMSDPTLGGAVSSSWLEGGDFHSAKDDEVGAFLMGAETVVACRVTAVYT